MSTLLSNITNFSFHIEDFNLDYLNQSSYEPLLSNVQVIVYFDYNEKRYGFSLAVTNTYDAGGVSCDLAVYEHTKEYDDFFITVANKEGTDDLATEELIDDLFEEIIEKNDIQSLFDLYVNEKYEIQSFFNGADANSVCNELLVKQIKEK
jgi:hypothetical protein